MSWEELIPKCIDLLQTYNPVTDSPDTHFQRASVKNEDKNETVFLQQVFYGVNRYREFLRRLNRAIFKVHATSTNSNDSYPFMIISYLALFRLDELGIKNFKRLVDTQEQLKMHVLLSFLFDEELLREHVRESWCEVYDYKFIDNEIISKATSRKIEMRNLLESLSLRATGQKTQQSEGEEEEDKEKTKEKHTIMVKPFNLTKPKPRRLPVPVEIPRKIQANKVDQKIFNNSLATVDEQNKKRFEEVKKQTVSKYDFQNDPIKRLWES
ncbi:unnamed protein product [Blepharisma stoltei]|uniref:Uncharacterized protein n=1 Tax=Blepharisma stoltei TaxID=1481888 RepID=A0AAU9JH85_9CILI|nr:unnamed protein product [Blepharisma stoltei]